MIHARHTNPATGEKFAVLSISAGITIDLLSLVVLELSALGMKATPEALESGAIGILKNTGFYAYADRLADFTPHEIKHARATALRLFPSFNDH